ncbi:MAG: hypothetical protein WBO10_09450 [Pyrinomonadaceae bacterium]
MSRLVIRFKAFLAALFGMLFLVTVAHACSCESYGEPRSDAKEYYTTKFKGAIFTGTLRKITHDPARDSGGITFSELLIEVDQYWLGVTKLEMTVLVPGPNTSCWFSWKTGQKSFFIAAEFGGRLYDSYCDRANWGGGKGSGTTWEDYTLSVLGKAKNFGKPK